MTTTNILLTLLGVLLGGFVSWVITYEYWRKAHAKKPVKESAHVTLDLTPQEIWHIITSPDFDSYLDWRGAYNAPPRLYEEHEVNNGMYRRKIYFKTISEPYELAWGGEPSKWDHRLTLQPLEKGTRLCLERVFWPYISNWLDFILDGFDSAKGLESNYSSVESDVQRIELYLRHFKNNIGSSSGPAVADARQTPDEGG